MNCGQKTLLFRAAILLASLLGQTPASAQTTVLPTDTLALPGRHKGANYVKLNASELRILQGLPAKLYVNVTNETSFRLESNPFQTPSRSHVVQSILLDNPGSTDSVNTIPTVQAGPAQTTKFPEIERSKPDDKFQSATRSTDRTDRDTRERRDLRRILETSHSKHIKQPPRFQNYTDAKQLAHVYDMQQVFREEPNLTIGWQFTPRSSLYSNYFLIRDVLMKSSSLNSTTQSLGGGWQYDLPIGKKTDLQPNLQFREMWQTGQPPVFDYLPAVTLTRQMGAATNGYVNAQMQLRGRKPFVAPHAELDQFYTAGFQTQRGRWQGSSSCTFLQNFRNIFASAALLPANSYGFICDFELDRQILPNNQGLQAFIRAEPLWNFHSNYTVGLSGFDFRLYYGLRCAVSKPALTKTMSDVRQDILQNEGG